MDNPFLKRATEQFRNDPEAFLGLISPEPLSYFLGKEAADGVLYDRLVLIEGTPGSGKTTLAQMFEYPTLSAMLRNQDSFRDLIQAMDTCGAVTFPNARVIACRLSLETDYRDFWEFDYPPEVKRGLMNTLVQARAVLAWMRNLESAGIDLDDISIIPRDQAVSAIESIGGMSGRSVANRALAVEQALYRIVAALVPPPVSRLESLTTDAYRPFDVIDKVQVRLQSDPLDLLDLTPLVILDDAHLLHPEQFESLRHWLTRRELRVARWVMTRLDILQTGHALAAITEERPDTVELPGITTKRDVTEIVLQGRGDGQDRNRRRREFRRMAANMANRYLSHMPAFRERNYRKLGDLLSTAPPPLISPSNLHELETLTRSTQKRLRIADSFRDQLATRIEEYRPDGVTLQLDVRLQMLNILLNRAAPRSKQTTLFDSDEELAIEPEQTTKVDSDIYNAACLALHHKYKRAFYYGIDTLCDAGSENAEQFLHLAAELVEAVGVQLIRKKGASLDAATQDRLLKQRAEAIIMDWDYPQHREVHRLIDFIAELCVGQSLRENAWNAPGPNAYGLLQAEFEAVTDSHPNLASALQFGVAYNAFRLIPRYSCKGKVWCLLELGGLSILEHGLSLRRGCFVEGSVAALSANLGKESA